MSPFYPLRCVPFLPETAREGMSEHAALGKFFASIGELREEPAGLGFGRGGKRDEVTVHRNHMCSVVEGKQLLVVQR